MVLVLVRWLVLSVLRLLGLVAKGDGEMMAIGIYTWENPSPEKKIRSIELIISGQNPHMDPMLFALSYSEFAGAFE